MTKRSSWKGINYNINKLVFTKKQVKKTWKRNNIIPEFLTNKQIEVHSGNKFFKVNVTISKIGFKLGNFVFTRQFTKKEVEANKTKGKETKKK